MFRFALPARSASPNVLSLLAKTMLMGNVRCFRLKNPLIFFSLSGSFLVRPLGNKTGVRAPLNIVRQDFGDILECLLDRF